MEQFQYLLLAVLVVAVVSYIVASSQNGAPTSAKPQLPPDQPEPVRPRAIPQQPRTSSGPPSTLATPTPQQSVPSASAKASTVTIRHIIQTPPPRTFAPTTEVTMAGQQAYRGLLLRVHGDRARAERLIAYEQKRDPHGTRLIWIQNAIASVERDNR
jgi:hypothetical protein